MKQTVILTLIFLFSFHLSSQNDYTGYYQLTGEGYTHYANGEYQKAIAIFELAFSNYYPFPDDVDMLKKCYLAIEDKEKAYGAMRNMILCGFQLKTSIPLINSGTSLGGYKTDTRSGDTILERRLAQEYPQLRAEYLKNIDWDADQYLKILTYFEIHTSLMRKMASVKEDDIVANLGFRAEKDMFMNLMASKQDVSRAKTDTWCSNEMEMVIIHTMQQVKKDEFQLYFQLLKEQVLKGNVSNLQYAICYDNWSYNYGKGSCYGQQAEFNPQTGSFKCAKIVDVKNVDKRRAEIGLPPLWVWSEIHKVELPDGYKRDI